MGAGSTDAAPARPSNPSLLCSRARTDTHTHKPQRNHGTRKISHKGQQSWTEGNVGGVCGASFEEGDLLLSVESRGWLAGMARSWSHRAP